jgi:hypothetical protein
MRAGLIFFFLIPIIFIFIPMRQSARKERCGLAMKMIRDDAVAAAGGLGSTGVLACSGGRPARRPTARDELSVW